MVYETMKMKIRLDWTKPEIWRRFIVRSTIFLNDLHEIVQIIMGWTNSHLHGFYINDVEYCPADVEFKSEAQDTKGISLKKLRLKENDIIRYVYDFGDNWEHTIQIEKIEISKEQVHTPRCLDGARNCPPEDCGSVSGYETLVTAMKKPNSAEAKEYIDWLGEPYDPEKFDIEEINAFFKPVKRTRGRGFGK